MPRIGEDLKLLLQSPVELVGDCFCFQDYTLIRIYGFEGEPFRLPKFTTRRLFERVARFTEFRQLEKLRNSCTKRILWKTSYIDFRLED